MGDDMSIGHLTARVLKGDGNAPGFLADYLEEHGDPKWSEFAKALRGEPKHKTDVASYLWPYGFPYHKAIDWDRYDDEDIHQTLRDWHRIRNSPTLLPNVHVIPGTDLYSAKYPRQTGFWLMHMKDKPDPKDFEESYDFLDHVLRDEPEHKVFFPADLDSVRQFLKDHGVEPKRVHLARADVVSQSISKQQKLRRMVAAKIAQEARLRLVELRDARTQRQSGVLQAYDHPNDPEGVDYAAAWYGLLTDAPTLSTFHVHDGGPDTFHTWTTPSDPDRVLSAANRLGLNAVVTSDGKVSVLDTGNQKPAVIQKLKEVTYANNPTAESGTAKPFADRKSYYNTIQRYRPSPAAAAGPAAAE